MFVPSLGLRHLSPLSAAIIDNREVLPHPGSDCTTTVNSEAISGIILRNSLMETIGVKFILLTLKLLIDY